jgi:hypothetical protein
VRAQDTASSADFVLPQVAMGMDAKVVGETPGGVAATGTDLLCVSQRDPVCELGAGLNN